MVIPGNLFLRVRRRTCRLMTCGVPVLQGTKQPVDKTVRLSTRKSVLLICAKLEDKNCMLERTDIRSYAQWKRRRLN